MKTRSIVLVILLWVAGLAGIAATFAYFEYKKGESTPPLLSPIISKDKWNITMFDGDSREIKAEGKFWRFRDEDVSCYVFIQRNKETFLPTMSCLR